MLDNKTILIVSKWVYPAKLAGGPAKSVHLLTESFARSGIEVFQLSSGKDLDGSFLATITDSNNLISAVRIRNLFQILIYYWRTIPLCNSVYINDFYSIRYNLVPFFICLFLGRKIILAPRGMLTPGALKFKRRKKFAYIRLLRFLGYFRATNIHFTDRSESEDFKKINISNNKSFVIPNFSAKGAFVEQVSLSKDEGIILKFVSRLSEKKNLHGLLTSLRLWGNEKLRLDIHGEFESPQYQTKCLNLLDTISNNVEVTFHGPFSISDLPKIYSHPSVFILPTFNENFGHSITEALSMAIPVLISRYTPWNEVERAGAGRILDISDENSFVTSLKSGLEFISSDYEVARHKAFNFFDSYIYDDKLSEKYEKEFFN